jgi:hypothetical protein
MSFWIAWIRVQAHLVSARIMPPRWAFAERAGLLKRIPYCRHVGKALHRTVLAGYFKNTTWQELGIKVLEAGPELLNNCWGKARR